MESGVRASLGEYKGVDIQNLRKSQSSHLGLGGQV